jgi:hypothetical protein
VGAGQRPRAGGGRQWPASCLGGGISGGGPARGPGPAPAVVQMPWWRPDRGCGRQSVEAVVGGGAELRRRLRRVGVDRRLVGARWAMGTVCGVESVAAAKFFLNL